ncbi:response regulator transcription factor [Allosphingosinicella deserti]|uniref:response regulator transcription factor n=1 Tax=Allosphingosinicella deserti TaxID=2116704 RepID=UPI001304AEF6|nr:response regulator [Sphingomonas deserti]
MTAERIISVVEDDESLRVALVGLLRASGYAGRGFASSEDYLGVRDGTCECVVTDIHLPGASGIEMIGLLRALGDDTPVIVITARPEPALEREAIGRGALCILRKPVEAKILLDCVVRALGA